MTSSVLTADSTAMNLISLSNVLHAIKIAKIAEYKYLASKSTYAEYMLFLTFIELSLWISLPKYDYDQLDCLIIADFETVNL